MADAKIVPHADDMEQMIDIHDRLIRRASLLVPMNMHDESNLGDAAIQFQDEAYECGRNRGRSEVNVADMVDSLRELLNLCAIGDVDEDTEAYGWGEAIKRAKESIIKATGSAA